MVQRRAISQVDVAGALSAGRPLDSGSGPWTRRFIDVAERQFDGLWHEVEISGEEALLVVLPPHAGEPCKGDRLSLVQPGGASTREAAETLRQIREDYERANPECWSRIAQAAAERFSPLILTTAPLDQDDYRTLRGDAGRLYHLDGFHRLVGWAWAGRLTSAARLSAFLAGPLVPRHQ